MLEGIIATSILDSRATSFEEAFKKRASAFSKSIMENFE